MGISIANLLEAGAHFGHRTRFWNPKMSPYIFCKKNKIHIINLEKTIPMLKLASSYIGKLVEKKSKILFVGTKRSAKNSICKYAKLCNMPYVDHRWLGGMLTNWKTVRQSIFRLKELKDMKNSGFLDKIIKKEALILHKELKKLDKSLGGIEDMNGLPDAIFIIDVGFENIAVKEANRLKIPIIGIVDTNNNPDLIDYVIPGNDDSMKAIEIYVKFISDTIINSKKNSIINDRT